MVQSNKEEQPTIIVNNYSQGGATLKRSWLAALLLSIFLGGFGIDRFYLGEIGSGVAKLLLSWMTLGIWWLIDVIRIATKSVKGIEWTD